MQMAGLAYLKLVQEEEHLPKFYVVKQVCPQLASTGKQIPHQLLRGTSHALSQTVDGVQQVDRQLLRVEGRAPS